MGLLLDGGLIHVGLARYRSAVADRRHDAGVDSCAMGRLFADLHAILGLFANPLWLAALLGGLGGPLAYLGAQRGWHAIAFADPSWRALALPERRLGTGNAALAWLARRRLAAPPPASMSP